MHIVLFEPEIPPNTGNIVRACKATDSVLHLIKPLGFSLDDKKLKRAGLDYWNDCDIRLHENFSAFQNEYPTKRLWVVETHGRLPYSDAHFQIGDFFLFGKETTGVPINICEEFQDSTIHIPMVRDNRSLNLANAVAIVLYEALRQTGFSWKC